MWLFLLFCFNFCYNKYMTIDVKNKKIAERLQSIAHYLNMDDIDYKPFAYERAASSILQLEESIEKIYEKNGKEGIEEISGVGKAIADKVEEFLLTGEMEHLKKLKKKFPVKMEELLRVEGLGPKSVKRLYKDLRVTDLIELKKAAKKGQIAKLDGFGEKTEKNILEAISFLNKDKGKWALGEVLPIAENIFNGLKSIPEIEKISFAGSLRRMKELVGDVDILVSARKPTKVMKVFTSFNGIKKVLGVGNTKASIRLEEGFDVDLRIVKPESFGAALQYFTGSKAHNIKIRKIAIDNGFKLNEYGLFKKDDKIAGETEKEIYNKLGLNFIPPEIRENRDEIEKAKDQNFSNLCSLEDIKGDLHTHTNWTGGANTLEEMVEAAEERDYDYLGISDHTKMLKIENGLDEEELLKQSKEIEIIAKEKNFKILHGCEANILKDGSLDIEDEVLKKLDYVIAGIHSNFKMTKKEMTERLLKAIRNPLVDIISHPTGRLIKKREMLPLDMEKVLEAAKKEGVILEINSSPARLDLSENFIRQCVDQKIKMIINSDSHHVNQLENIKFGVGQARRGWAEKDMIINTYKTKKLLKILLEN